VPCNRVDRLLFSASTTITIGDGKTTKFWHDSWLDGIAPMNIAPHLFDLISRKNNSVAHELSGEHWIKTLSRITSTVQIEFVSLWNRLWIFSCNLTHRIPLPGIGLLMVFFQLNRPIEHSSLARTVTLMLTLSGRHAQNQNENFLFGFSCRKNSSRPTISPPVGGLISRLVPSATEPLRLVFTSVYIVLSPVRCGDKSWLGKV
jgi:hypothetical protein